MKNPINILRHLSRDRAPRDPVTIGTMILGASATAATTITIAGAAFAAGAYVVGYIAVTAVTSVVLKALSPKQTAGGGANSSGILANVMDPAASHEYVYGKVRKGGVRTYIEATGDQNKFLHMIIVLAGHEVAGIDDIYINDEIVTLDGSGIVTDAKWNNKVRIKKHLGDQTTADPDLLAETSQVNSNFVGRGIAYLYVRLEYDQDVFANGIPLFTATVRGRKVYDPRTGATGYSANAALAVRDYLTADFGLNDSAMDDLSFAASANVSDEAIPLAVGGTEARYQVNGIISADMSPRQVMERMMTTCAGTLFWGQGAWQLHVAYYTAPVTTLTLDDLRSSISLDTRASARDNFNRVTGTFIDASAGYISADYPPLESATFLAEDDGVSNTLDLQLPMTTSASAAQRLAKLVMFRAREQMTLSADFGMAAFGVQVGDIVAFTNDRYGWTAKEFEVAGWKFDTGQEGAPIINLTLRETSEAAFAWNAEETAIIRNNTTLPDYRYVPPVGLSVIGGELRLVNQQVVGAVVLDVTLDPTFAASLEVQYRQSSATEWLPVGATQSISASNHFEVVGISDGNFDFRARATNALGIRGDWNTVSNSYVTLFTSPPANVTNFAGNVVGNTLHLTWTPAPDLDLSHYKIRYAAQLSGASYQDARDIVDKVSRPANSITVPSQSGTYFIKAVDKLGNVSQAPASIVISTNVADIDGLNVIENLIQHPAFAGGKTNIALLNDDEGNYLALDTITLFDAAVGNFDDQAGLFDGGGEGGVMQPLGYYEFENYLDLGSKYVSRVSTSMDIRYLDYANTFDAAAGLFDAYLGDFDGDPTQFDTTTARTQVSFTDNDPAGSPVWSDWHDFIVGDISARAIRFRAILATSSNSATPAIRSLTATVDMPDRVEAQSDIVYTGSQTITFPAAFKVPPAIGIAASLSNGDRYVISGKTRAGFTIETFTGAIPSTNATQFDYVAKGYGRELV